MGRLKTTALIYLQPALFFPSRRWISIDQTPEPLFLPMKATYPIAPLSGRLAYIGQLKGDNNNEFKNLGRLAELALGGTIYLEVVYGIHMAENGIPNILQNVFATLLTLSSAKPAVVLICVNPAKYSIQEWVDGIEAKNVDLVAVADGAHWWTG
jgi:hypothetical protein